MSHSRMKRTLKWPFDDILTWFLPSFTFVGKNKFKIENEFDVIKRPIELVIQYFYHLRFQGLYFYSVCMLNVEAPPECVWIYDLPGVPKRLVNFSGF